MSNWEKVIDIRVYGLWTMLSYDDLYVLSRFISVDRIHTSCIGSFFFCTLYISGVAFLKKKVNWLYRVFGIITLLVPVKSRSSRERGPSFQSHARPIKKKDCVIVEDQYENILGFIGGKPKPYMRKNDPLHRAGNHPLTAFFLPNLKTLQFIFPSHRGRSFILLSL